MSLNKKQKIDWSDNVINQIDIASENLLLKHVDNEQIKTKLNQIRMEMIDKIKEIEHLNLSNSEQKFMYFVQFHGESLWKIQQREENLLGNLVIQNKDLSHIVKNFR